MNSKFTLYFWVLALCVLVVNANWCNETKIEQRVRTISYEEKVQKRKGGFVCKLRGKGHAPCLFNETVVKERPEIYEETVLIPKCCEGYELKPSSRCLPICTIPCASGVCSAPNVCYMEEQESAIYAATTNKADLDYYDENDEETSTPQTEEIEDEEIPQGNDHPEGRIVIETTTWGDEVTEITEGNSQCSSGGCGNESQSVPNIEEQIIEGGGESEGHSQSKKRNWILWVSVSGVLMSLSLIGYIIYVKLIRTTRGGCDDHVVEYSS